MPNSRVNARTWHRFNVRRLAIAPAVVGARHFFSFSGNRIEVRIPSLQKDDAGKERTDRIKCFEWKMEGGEKVPEKYAVSSIDLLVDVGHTMVVPNEALVQPPVQPHLFSEKDREILGALLTEHAGVADQAMWRWLKVLRWKTRIGSIGEPIVVRHESGWGTYLLEAKTERPFWISKHTFIVSADRAVTAQHWGEVQTALNEGIEPPLWFEFLFEAQHRFSNGDATGAVLSTAIGFEALLRTMIAKQVPPEVTSRKTLVDLLDLTNLRAIINRRRDLPFWDDLWEKHHSSFHQLMNARDKIMHSGNTEAVSKLDWEDVTRAVIEIAYHVADR